MSEIWIISFTGVLVLIWVATSNYLDHVKREEYLEKARKHKRRKDD